MGVLLKLTNEYFKSEKREEDMTDCERTIYKWVNKNNVKFITVSNSNGEKFEVADRNFFITSQDDHSEEHYDSIMELANGLTYDIEGGFTFIDSELMFDLLRLSGKYSADGKSVVCSSEGNEISFELSDGDIHSGVYICGFMSDIISIFDNTEKGEVEAFMIRDGFKYRKKEMSEGMFIRLMKKKK